MNQKKHYLIYQITNSINGKIYIGKHETFNIDDDYFGSGKALKHAQKKYGLENFIKTILFELQNEEEMNLLEKCVVTEDFCKRQDTYNINVGGDGGWYHVNSEKKNIGFKYANEHGLNNNGDHSLKMDPILHALNIKEGLKKAKELHPEKFNKAGINNPMFGKHMSEESKKKSSESHKGKRNSSFGKHWYHNLVGQRKMFYPFEVPDGWFRK